MRMRDPNRLAHFYRELWLIHKTKVPNMRFCQLFSDFAEWVLRTQGRDWYYIEEDQALLLLKEYILEITGS